LESLIVPSAQLASLPGGRLLVLAPHPDDEIFGCGGAILRHLEKGGTVKVLIFTDGAFGVAAEKLEASIAQRQQESLAAAKRLGYGVPTFRGYADRQLHYGEALICELMGAIEQSGADLVCAPSVMEMHPDHRALAMAAVEAVRRIGAPIRLALYEVGVPLEPNLLVDISAVAEQKMQAMQCFASQLKRQRYDLHIAGLNRFRSYSLPDEVTAAEAYRLVTAETLHADPFALYRPWYRAQRLLGLPASAEDIPLCSVLIRSMNRATLQEALDSVALQTWANLEVVVVNATGQSHARLGAHCGPFPLRLVESGLALDRARAANVGLSAARGSFLLFLDDDDLIFPHHLAALIAAFKGNPDLMAAYSGVICTDSEGKTVRTFAEPFDPLKLRLQNYLPIHAVVFRREALAKGLRFDERLPVCEDWDFWLHLLEHWGERAFKFVPETGAVYRVAEGGNSGVWREPDRTRRIMLQIYRKWLPQWSDQTLWSLFDSARCRSQVDALLTENTQSASKLAELEARCTELLTSLREREARCDQLATNLGELQAQSTRQRATLSARESELGALREHHVAMHAALEAQSQAIQERDGRLERLHNSRSWRLTRPLRAFSEFLGAPGIANPDTARQTEKVKFAADPEPHAILTDPAAGGDRGTPSATIRLTYEYPVDLESETAAAFVYRMVGKDRRVLELGCGPGSITRVLAQYGGCRVTGVEFDSASVEKARPFCEQIVQADLNDQDWPAALGEVEPFEVVLAADVLEHLNNPWLNLKQLRSFVGKEGCLVLSLPHAGHAALAASFLNSNVQYRDWGLLDRTHLRFFGLRNIEELVAQAGFKIVEASYVRRAPEESELALNWMELPQSLRQALASAPYADIYQIVIRAVLIESDGEALRLEEHASISKALPV